MPKYDPSIHKIKVQTWGTKDKKSDGVDNYVEEALLGGNVGHASIMMSLPITEETKKWIEKYCFDQTFEEYKESLPLDEQEDLTFDDYLEGAKNRIPITHNTDTTYLSKLKEDGTREKTNKVASKAEYFQINFSWWPGVNAEGKDSFYLSNTKRDMVREREGKHFEYSDAAQEYLQPEQRRHGGIIGSQLMTYAPATIVHQRDLSKAQRRKVDMELQVEKIDEDLEVRDLLNQKIKALQSAEIEKDSTLDSICKNIRLNIDQLKNAYLEKYPAEKKPGIINVDNFKQFFLESVEQHMKMLEETKEQLTKDLKKLRMDVEESHYITKGVHPDHTVTLPYLDDDRRGLSPEEMLKKMRELSEPNAAAFNLHTKNCSKTTTAVLTAGAAHDPLLEHALSREALGFFGTPQQVLGNVLEASDIIVQDKENNLRRRIGNMDFLKQAMGTLLSVIMDPSASKLQKGLAGTALFVVALLKTPGAALSALFNPSETMANIISGVTAVGKHADSNILKGVVGFLSAIPLILLAPFAFIEQGLKLLAQPFQTSANRLSKTESSHLDAQISSPLPSTKGVDPGQETSYHAIMGRLVDAKVASRIKEHSHELAGHPEKSPLQILIDFEHALKENPDKVMTLSDQYLHALNEYLSDEEDPSLTARFQACCNESLKRANDLCPKTPQEVDELVDEEEAGNNQAIN